MAPLPLRGSLSLVPETAAAMRSCRGRDRVGCCAAAIETPTWAGPQALDLRLPRWQARGKLPIEHGKALQHVVQRFP